MENKKRLIDADALIELARNHVGGMVDCNDIARFPTVDAVVLPCKDDDIVFVNLFGQVLPFVVISTNLFKGTPIFKAQHGINLVWMFRPYDLGKTVFLTREEAESALAKMDGDGNG